LRGDRIAARWRIPKNQLERSENTYLFG
jgi:hypothetical protein